jgi:hypothetical protein
MNTTRLDKTDASILKRINLCKEDFSIPSYLDKDEVMEVLEDAIVLKQWDNEHNYCVLCAWVDEDSPFNTLFYFTRFFTIGNKTVCSHDATGDNLFDMMVKVSELANKHFE